MNHSTAITLLDDHVDGLLSPEQTLELEAHIQGCDTCRAELAQLRSLLEQAAALPTEIEPERDLWSGIATRIEGASSLPLSPDPSPQRGEREKGPWYVNPRVLALAAALLVGATVAATRLLTPEPPAPSVAEAPAQPETLAHPAWEDEMTTASVALGQTLEARRAQLQPATIAIIDDNLHIIDTAIEDCRAALISDPANTQLEAAMLSAWQRKVGLLERATTLPPNS